MTLRSNRASLMAMAAVTLTSGLALSACDKAGGRTADTPSGFPVPRYVSLSKGEAAGRAGPSEDHRIVALYHARGMPLQVVAETEEWKRVCDPFGGPPVWMKNRLVTGARTVVRVKSGAVGLHKRPNDASDVIASLPPKAIATFDRCDKGWCRVKVGSIKGWLPAQDVWGVAPEPQCHG
jgi:SH3-like domain-containing protein